MTDREILLEMLRHVQTDVEYVRKRFDGHVKDNSAAFALLRRDNETASIALRGEMAQLREVMSGHRVKLGLIVSGLGLMVVGLMSWIVRFVGGER